MNSGLDTTEFLTTKEVAELLRIKERKLYDLVSAQEIPCVKGHWQIAVSQSRAFALDTHGRISVGQQKQCAIECSGRQPRPASGMGHS